MYTHKDARRLLEALSGEKIYRRESLEIVALDRELVGWFAERLERRMRLALSVTDSHLYLTIGSETLDAVLERPRLLHD